MRSFINIFNLKALLMLTLSFVSIQSCIQTSKIYIENDLAFSSKRIKWEYTYYSQLRKSPLIYMEQSIIKEIKPNNQISYKVYDVLVLSDESFKLEDNVYLIIDDEAMPMDIENKEFEQTKSISTNNKEILTSDSTKVSVVTGYSENSRKIVRINYILKNDVIEKIKKAKHIIFQYYSGPDMITLELEGLNFEELKRALNEI